MMMILRESGYSLAPGHRVLDFGCGAGRMIRWLKDAALSCEIWGADINANYIFWCQQHLSPPFNFVVTTTLPHLPFEDGYFDMIYAGSVFTHVDDLARTWLLELRRVTSVQGRLYITVHDKHTLEILRRDGRLPLSRLVKAGKGREQYVQSSFGMLTVGRATESQVFYDIDYLRRLLEPAFRVVSVVEEAYGYQTAMVLEPATR
jgi:ubiquinone/menaquinone biosynthesis C-methylase UbiE